MNGEQVTYLQEYERLKLHLIQGDGVVGVWIMNKGMSQ